MVSEEANVSAKNTVVAPVVVPPTVNCVNELSVKPKLWASILVLLLVIASVDAASTQVFPAPPPKANAALPDNVNEDIPATVRPVSTLVIVVVRAARL